MDLNYRFTVSEGIVADQFHRLWWNGNALEGWASLEEIVFDSLHTSRADGNMGNICRNGLLGLSSINIYDMIGSGVDSLLSLRRRLGHCDNLSFWCSWNLSVALERQRDCNMLMEETH